MKTNTSPAPRNSNENHPPLARDAHGNLVAVPEGAAAWTFKRETRGRPKLIVGPDRQPARFPLETTSDDLEQMLGAGTYRVYAINEVGTTIDYVTTIVVGGDDDDEDDAGPAASEPRATAAASRGPGSDLRFALETIRDTTRSLADSLKSVAASQADWVKGLAAAKAIPRNAPPWLVPPPPAPPAPREDEDVEDDEIDDAEDDAAGMGNVNGTLVAMSKIADAITSSMQTVKEIRNRFAEPSAPPPAPEPEAPRNGASSAPEAAPRHNPMIHLAEIDARLTKQERKFLSVALRGEDGPGVTEELLRCSIPDAVRLVRRAMRRTHREVIAEDPAYDREEVPSEPPASVPPEATAHGATDFMGHVMATSAFLTGEERATVLRLLPKLPADRLEQLKVKLLRMAPAQAAAWVKTNLEALRGEVSS